MDTQGATPVSPPHTEESIFIGETLTRINLVTAVLEVINQDLAKQAARHPPGTPHAQLILSLRDELRESLEPITHVQGTLSEKLKDIRQAQRPRRVA